jgi:hypothetical protein
MASTSTANPYSRFPPMAMTKLGQPLSLSLWAENRALTKEQSALRSALSSASCRRSGRSPALPYPPHECLQFTLSLYLPFPMGTSLLCITGDISILH